jgi:hypothetical protein
MIGQAQLVKIRGIKKWKKMKMTAVMSPSTNNQKSTLNCSPGSCSTKLASPPCTMSALPPGTSSPTTTLISNSPKPISLTLDRCLSSLTLNGNLFLWDSPSTLMPSSVGDIQQIMTPKSPKSLGISPYQPGKLQHPNPSKLPVIGSSLGTRQQLLQPMHSHITVRSAKTMPNISSVSSLPLELNAATSFSIMTRPSNNGLPCEGTFCSQTQQSLGICRSSTLMSGVLTLGKHSQDHPDNPLSGHWMPGCNGIVVPVHLAQNCASISM